MGSIPSRVFASAVAWFFFFLLTVLKVSPSTRSPPQKKMNFVPKQPCLLAPSRFWYLLTNRKILYHFFDEFVCLFVCFQDQDGPPDVTHLPEHYVERLRALSEVSSWPHPLHRSHSWQGGAARAHNLSRQRPTAVQRGANALSKCIGLLWAFYISPQLMNTGVGIGGSVVWGQFGCLPSGLKKICVKKKKGKKIPNNRLKRTCKKISFIRKYD